MKHSDNTGDIVIISLKCLAALGDEKAIQQLLKADDENLVEFANKARQHYPAFLSVIQKHKDLNNFKAETLSLQQTSSGPFSIDARKPSDSKKSGFDNYSLEEVTSKIKKDIKEFTKKVHGKPNFLKDVNKAIEAYLSLSAQITRKADPRVKGDTGADEYEILKEAAEFAATAASQLDAVLECMVQYKDSGLKKRPHGPGALMAWFIPSFNRPQQCGALLRQIATIGTEYPGFVLVNGGHTEAEYREVFKQYLPKHWDFAVIKDNIGCIQSANWYFQHFPNDPFYGFISDDETVHTPGWEKLLIGAAGDWRMSNANDGWQSEQRFHGLTTFGGELIRLIGWWGLKGLWHWCGEDVWEQINKDFHLRVFCEEVICEHRHHLNRKAPLDDTYKSGEARVGPDKERYTQWLRLEYPALKARLKAGIPADILATAKSA